MFNIFSKQAVLVFLFFILLTIIFTFPIILKMNSLIPSFHSSDEPYAAIWYFWWIKYACINNLNISYINVVTAPFGQYFQPGYVYWNIINKISVLLSNPVFTYNIQVIFSFIFTGLFTYILVFYLFRTKLVALFSALIFAFCPYHFARSWQHLGLAQIQWIPLYILSLLNLRKDMTIKNAIFSGIFFVLIMVFDLYYAYFMFIVTILFVSFDYFHKKKLKETFKLLKLLLITTFIILVIESFDIYHIARFIFAAKKLNVSQNVYGYIRPFEDLFSQSARPLSYFLPATVHPIFGKFTEQFIGSSLYGMSFTEHTLYLGWISLILAFVALRRWRYRRKEINKMETVPFGDSPHFREDFYIGFFLFLAITTWLFSQPPWWKIGSIKIFMPSFFMYKIAPMFRAYCRFGIVVMLAIAVLAGFGLKFILEKFKSQRTKIALTCLFSGLVLFEFWNWPPYKVIDVSKVPQVYYWLKEQPGDFVIAEYPIDAESTNEMYKFYQTAHEKKIINGTIPGTYANKVAQTIRGLSDPNTAGILKWMGVKYVIVHREDYLRTELTEEIEELDKIPQNPGLKLIKTFPPQECPQKDIMCIQKTGLVDVYEVVVLPIEPRLDE